MVFLFSNTCLLLADFFADLAEFLVNSTTKVDD